MKKSILKKILIGILVLFLIIVIASILFPLDYYKEGQKYYNQKNYKKAINYLSKVDKEDPNYQNAIEIIEIIKPIVNSIDSNELISKQAYNSKKQIDKPNSLQEAINKLLS